MKIAIVGGGASALICANMIKSNNPKLDVLIIEKNDKLAKKMKMTGNGKCNLAPLKDDKEAYNNPDFISKLFNEIPLDNYLAILKDLGIPTKAIKNQGYYPLSENAPNVVNILTNNLINKGVEIINKEVIDYKNDKKVDIYLKDKSIVSVDKVIFATGGKSYSNTGSDGSIFNILNKHGYQINELKPSLCPIKVKENIKSLFGSRAHGKLSLIKNGKIIYQESGEIMFKKDAISGISAMNASSYIAHNDGNYQISLNLLEGDFIDSFVYNKQINVIDGLLSYVQYPIALYIIKKLKIKENDLFINHLDEIEFELKNLTFTYEHLYDFDSAQITAGGIDIKQIDNSFKSIKENNTYFIGEMLDIDGLCGGYNLRFALTSAIKVAQEL